MVELKRIKDFKPKRIYTRLIYKENVFLLLKTAGKSRHVDMQCGGHGRVTEGARLQLLGPTPANRAEAEMPARQQQNTRLPLATQPAPPVTVATAVPFILILRLGVAAAAARFHVVLHRRRASGVAADMLQNLLQIAAK